MASPALPDLKEGEQAIEIFWLEKDVGMHFSLVKLFPEGVHTNNGFDDVMLPMRYALARLGYDVEMTVNRINPTSINILFGSCQTECIDDRDFPANSIIFNLEQLTAKSSWNTPRYLEQLKRFTVWDYSHRNIRYCRKSLGMTDVFQVRLGYVPEMTRLARDFPRDIDVLFYGCINERRHQILEQLSKAKLRVCQLNGEYGLSRDLAIARSKVVVNIHFYTPATLEVPRLGYLWANHRPVVSERHRESEVDKGLEESCCFCSYDELVSKVHELAASERAREEQATKAFAAFSSLRQEDFLESVVGRRIHGSALPRRPDWLHVGSGKDFRQECLNVDINPAMNPDVVLDMSLPLDPAARHATVRFGEVRLMPGSFARITAFEVLEHVGDLPALMCNFLDLLCNHGELHISVPYDLSCGAWQDPTHVRAFNQNSWLYYSSRAWYLGWRNNRFDIVSIIYIKDNKLIAASDVQDKDKLDELLRTPRAIDAMYVIFRKRQTTEEEKAEYARMTRSFYDGAVGEWSVRDERRSHFADSAPGFLI